MKSTIKLISFCATVLAASTAVPAYAADECPVNLSNKSCATPSRSMATNKSLYASVRVTGVAQVNYRIFRGSTAVWSGSTSGNAGKMITNTGSTAYYYGNLYGFAGLAGTSAKMTVTYY